MPRLIAIMGPTASGKSSLAEKVADDLDAVILNADAFQVYRYMDIGTAKPLNRSRYELLDIKNPDEAFGVGEFIKLASHRLNYWFDQERNVIVCGGTGFYIRALMEEFDDLDSAPEPELRAELERRLEKEGLESLVEELKEKSSDMAMRTDLKNPVRVRRALEKTLSIKPKISFSLPPYVKEKVAIVPDSAKLASKIRQRCSEMLQTGWVEEVKALLELGYKTGDPGFRAIGYESIEKFVFSSKGLEDLEEQIGLETVQYAKRQRTWLRSEPSLTVFETSEEAHQFLMK